MSDDDNNNNKNDNTTTTTTTTPKKTDQDDSVLSEETVKRICKHMNEDHAVSVYAMARSLILANQLHDVEQFHLTQANLKNITLEYCTIQAMFCSGEMCQVATLEYPLGITRASELRSRLIEIHHVACQPQNIILPLATWSFCTVIVLLYAILAYFVLGVGYDGLLQILKLDETREVLYDYPSIVSENAHEIIKMMQYLFWLTLVGHTLLADYVAYKARTVLKLNWRTTIIWFITVFLAGYITSRQFQQLLQVHRESQKVKRQKEKQEKEKIEIPKQDLKEKKNL